MPLQHIIFKVKDRDGWRRLLESAKTLHGLKCLGVSEWRLTLVNYCLDKHR